MVRGHSLRKNEGTKTHKQEGIANSAAGLGRNKIALPVPSSKNNSLERPLKYVVERWRNDDTCETKADHCRAALRVALQVGRLELERRLKYNLFSGALNLPGVCNGLRKCYRAYFVPLNVYIFKYSFNACQRHILLYLENQSVSGVESSNEYFSFGHQCCHDFPKMLVEYFFFRHNCVFFGVHGNVAL